MKRLAVLVLVFGCAADGKEIEGETFLDHIPGLSLDPIARVLRDGTDLDFLAFDRADPEVPFHHNEGRLTAAGLARMDELAGQFAGQEGVEFGSCGATDGPDLAVTLESSSTSYTIALCPSRAGDLQPLEDFGLDVLSALRNCTGSELVATGSNCTLLD